MSRMLHIRRAGPSMTLQDLGREGYLGFGLSRGGAADRLALYEGAALLGQSPALAAIEMAGMGGVFEASEEIRIALTGAPMRADADGTALVWNASHLLEKGAKLTIGPALSGSYGYLHIGGGIDAPMHLGARSAHLAAGLGDRLETGESLPLGQDKAQDTGLKLPADARFEGGLIRLVPSVQTGFFARAEIERFEETRFKRDTRGNRMGVRLLPEGEGFKTEAGLKILSEVIVPGDIQITGDGTPFVLLSECQTTGGYPRIGSVLPSDLPRVAQAAAGAELRFAFVSLEEATQIEAKAATARKSLGRSAVPLIRDPASISDLLSYQLISGVTSGREEP